MESVLLIIAALGSPPQLSTGVIESDPHKLVEIRVESHNPPEGMEFFQSRWLVVDPDVDWRQYENGSVFAATAPPGTYQARLWIQYMDWEKRTGHTEERVYTIRVRGPPKPEPPPVPDVPVPDPTPPVDLTGEIYAISIRHAGQLTAPQSEALLRIQEWASAEAGFRALEFPPDAVNGDGSRNSVVAGYADKIPSGKSMPYVFVVQNKRGGGSFIHWSGELLSAEQVIDTMQGAAQ